MTILAHDEATNELFVTSSMQGEKADWYRNLRASPGLQVDVGRNRFEVTQRFLDHDERAELYRTVCKRKPLRVRFGLFLTGHKWPTTDEDFERLADEMPAVAFRLRR